MKNYDPCKFLNGLFDLENKVAVVIGGTGVICGDGVGAPGGRLSGCSSGSQ